MPYGHDDGAASGLCTSAVRNVGLSDVSLSSLCKMRLNDSLFAQFSMIQGTIYLDDNPGYAPTPLYPYPPHIEPTVEFFPTLNNVSDYPSHTASPFSYSSCSSSAASTPSPYAASIDLPHRDCYSRVSTPVDYHRPTSSASSYSLPQDPRHTLPTLSGHTFPELHGELQFVSAPTDMATQASALTPTATYSSCCPIPGSDAYSVSSHGSPYNSPYMAPSVGIGTYDYPSPPAAEMPSPSLSYTSNTSQRAPRQRSSLSRHARRNVVTDAKSFPPSMGSGSKGTSVAQALGGRPMRLIEEPKRDYTKVACKPCRSGKKKCGGDSKSACP
jgi:hypothetical protein